MDSAPTETTIDWRGLAVFVVVFVLVVPVLVVGLLYATAVATSTPFDTAAFGLTVLVALGWVLLAMADSSDRIAASTRSGQLLWNAQEGHVASVDEVATSFSNPGVLLIVGTVAAVLSWAVVLVEFYAL